MNILRPIIATIIALIIGLLVTSFAGENPLNVFIFLLNQDSELLMILA